MIYLSATNQEDTMFVIDMASEAGARLEAALALPSTHKVSIDVRGPNHVAIKVNENMWTHTMRANFDA
jgi:hypothetical protein